MTTPTMHPTPSGNDARVPNIIVVDDGDRWRIIDNGYEPPAPRADWPDVLDGIEYPPVSAADGGPDAKRPDDLVDAVREELLAMAERLRRHAGHAVVFKGPVYRILLHHIYRRFLDGDSLGFATPRQLDEILRTLPAVEEGIKAAPGLIDGMVKYPVARPTRPASGSASRSA